MTIRAWGDATPEFRMMDGNTGRSEVLDPNRSFIELRVASPD